MPFRYLGRGCGRSLPSRERGLKFQIDRLHNMLDLSLPSRERGLKFSATGADAVIYDVAPFAGAWIEISRLALVAVFAVCRSLRGSVD